MELSLFQLQTYANHFRKRRLRGESQEGSKWYNGKKGDSGARLEGSHSRKDVIPHAYIQQIGAGQDSAYYHIQW
ncbi:hypothetical protein QF049_003782 [Paenibacillus sp. W4I10]|nr:hypothetical protein [Paenibacillus sp. W4I10]